MTDAPLSAGEPARRNVRAVARLETEERDREWLTATIGAIASWAARPSFVAVHMAWFAGWVLYNTMASRAFDPYPFNFLTLVVSLEAIILSAFVLMAQDRATRTADLRAQIDLQVDLLAEQELTAILQSLSLIARKVGVDLKRHVNDFEPLERATEVDKIAAALHRSTKAAGDRGRRPDR